MVRILLTLFFVLALLDTAFAGFLPKAFEAEFTQETKSKISKRVRKSKLKIKYQFSSNINFKDLATDTLYICNKKDVWIYTPPLVDFPGEKGQVRIGSSSKYCYSKIFDSLSKGLTNNNLYTVKKNNTKKYTLTFSKKAKAQLGFEKLEILFKKQAKKISFLDVDRMNIHYTDQKHPTILVNDKIKKKKNFPKGTFIFQVPKNTDIQKMR